MIPHSETDPLVDSLAPYYVLGKTAAPNIGLFGLGQAPDGGKDGPGKNVEMPSITYVAPAMPPLL